MKSTFVAEAAHSHLLWRAFYGFLLILNSNCEADHVTALTFCVWGEHTPEETHGVSTRAYDCI